MSGLIDRLQHKARVMVYNKRFGKKWATPLADNGIYPPPGTMVDLQSRLVVPGLGTPIAEPNAISLALMKGIRLATDLSQRAGANLSLEADKIDIEVAGIKAQACDLVDLHIFHEIFVERIYHFDSPGSFLFMDIGMNVGLASLDFAKRYDAEVHGYELIPSTCEFARKNVALNPDLASRIHLNEFGIADEDKQFTVRFAPNDRAGNSIFGRDQGIDTEVKVRDIAAEFAKLHAQLNGRKFAVKLDAEGAEYEILARMEAEGQLKQVDVLLLEWHDREGKNPTEIHERLRRNGFQWFERAHPEAPVGLLNAFRP